MTMTPNGEIEIGWTFLVRKHWGGNTNRVIKRLMLNHAFSFADTVVFWVGESNWRSQRAMEKIGAIRRDGLAARPSTGGPHLVFEINKKSFRLTEFALVTGRPSRMTASDPKRI